METIKQLASVIRKQIEAAKTRTGMYALGATSKSYIPWMEGSNIPSRNEQFYYVGREDGLVQIQQDAAFLVEHIIVPVTIAAASLDLTRVVDVSIIDTNSGRTFTDGTKPVLPVGEAGQQRNVLFSQSISLTAIVPIGPLTTAAGLWQYDAWFALDTELMLPRGGSVRFAPTIQTNGSTESYPYIPFVLAGYKVFG